MSDVLIVERHGAVMLLRLNRPEARNATSPELNSALIAACDQAEADLTVGCIVLTGEGSAFSAGGNIKNMHERKGLFGHPTVKTPEAFRRDIQAVPRRFLSLDVPVIAAINGHAIGAGLDFALMCDVRIASEAASFAESFIRVGLIPGDGGAWLLPRAVGMAAAMEMALTAEPVDASRALELRLVSRVVRHDELLPQALALGEKIARHSPQAIRMTKRLFRASEGTTFNHALEQAAFMQSVLKTGADHHEAVTALLEKRAPTFTGG
jgi:enoyl-CoA hydratase/carnithine racemase